MPGGGYGRFGRRIIGPIIVVAAALALSAACSSGSSSTTAIPPPLRATATSSPSQAASVRPGKKSEVAAAKAVLLDYFSVLKVRSSASAAAHLSRIEAVSCPCRRQVNVLRAAARKSEHYVAPVQLRAIKSIYSSGTKATFLVLFDAGRAGLVNARGSFVTSVAPMIGVSQEFTLRDGPAGWRIAAIMGFK